MPENSVLWPWIPSLLMVAVLGGCRPSTTEADIGRAMTQLQIGETSQGIELLQSVVADHPRGDVGDRAALCLGNALINARRHHEALAPLRRAAAGVVGPHYARLLLVRAVVGGELEADYGEAEQLARTLRDSPDYGAVVQEEAAFSLLKLAWLRSSYESAAAAGSEFLRLYPDSDWSHEARWLTARSLHSANRLPEAQKMFESIWFDTPASPWAIESEKLFLELSGRTGMAPRRLSAERHGRFVEDLQRAGLHDSALSYIESFLQRFSGSAGVDRILYRKTVSLHVLRRNDECVATALRLRRRSPNSAANSAMAGLVAIRCLRRDNKEREVREWVAWIVRRFPGTLRAQEAQYALGSFLTNVVSEQDGLAVMMALLQRTGDSGPIRDAHWNAAWTLRNLGRTRDAADMLARLLNRFPTSGYRDAALYWRARFLSELNSPEAVQLYQECVSRFPNDYYGHQSREKLLALGATPAAGRAEPFPAVDLLDGSMQRANPGEGYLRAVHLKSIGLYGLAAQELLSDPGSKDDPGLRFSKAYLLSRAGDPLNAFRQLPPEFKKSIAGGSRDPKVVPREFWEIVYPYNYRAEIAQAIRDAGLEGTRIDVFLVAALIRHESLFDPSAVSSQGALGLMQLMPATAREIALERGIPPPSQPELYDPAVNIRYGVFYLAKLVREFNGDFFPAICAYNAGSGPVRSWWRKKPPDQPLDEFIENIPYPATRRYVKDVLGDYRNYTWIYSPSS